MARPAIAIELEDPWEVLPPIWLSQAKFHHFFLVEEELAYWRFIEMTTDEKEFSRHHSQLGFLLDRCNRAHRNIGNNAGLAEAVSAQLRGFEDISRADDV